MEERLEAQIRKLQEFFWSDADPEGRGFVPLADTFRRAGDYQESRRLLRDGLERHPGLASGHVVLGWVFQDQGDPRAAEGSFRTALTLDPQNLYSLKGLGAILMERGEVGEALRILQDLLVLDPLDEDLPARVTELEGAQEVEPEEEVVEEVERSPWEDDEGIGEELDWRKAAIQDDESDLPVADEPVADEPLAEGAEFAAEGEEMAGPEPEPGVELEPESETEPEGEAEPELDPGLAAEAGLEVSLTPELPEEEMEPEPLHDSLVTRTMGEIFLRQGLWNQAGEVFLRLLEKDPENPEIRSLLADAEVGRRSDEEASAPAETLAPEVIVPIEDLAPDVIVPIESLAPGGSVPIEDLAPDVIVPIESPAPGDIVPGEDLAPEGLLPIEDLAPDLDPEVMDFSEEMEPDLDLVSTAEEMISEGAENMPVAAMDSEDLIPVGSIPPEGPAPEGDLPPSLVVPVEALAPELVIPVEELAPDPIVSMDAMAPEPVLSIDEVAPDLVVSVGELAPDLVVSIDELAPDPIVFIQELAPDPPASEKVLDPVLVLPIGELAPDVILSIEALAPDPSAESQPDDPTLDDFERWLSDLS